jgi:hypothetical protein
MTITTVRTIALGTAAAMTGLAALAAGASAQTTCEWYGRTALKQQQENVQLKCGFTGPEWSSDLRAHMAWCASVPPDVWKKSAQSRDQQLAACGQGKKS